MDEEVLAHDFLGHDGLFGAVSMKEQADDFHGHNGCPGGDFTPWFDGSMTVNEVSANGFDDSHSIYLAVDRDFALPEHYIWSMIEEPVVLAERSRIERDLVELSSMVEGPHNDQKAEVTESVSAAEVTQLHVTSGLHHYGGYGMGQYQTWTTHSHEPPETAESSTQVQASSTFVYPENLIQPTNQSSVTEAQDEEDTMTSDIDPMDLAIELLSEGVSSTSLDGDSDGDLQERDLITYRPTSPNKLDEVSMEYGLVRPGSGGRTVRKNMLHEWLDHGGSTIIIPDGAVTRNSVGTGPCDILQPTDLRQPGDSRWAEQLLNLCAAAIASKNIGRTQHLMWVLNDLASFTGDPNQRLAAYGLKALFCRITGGKEAVATYMRPFHHQEETLGPKAVHRAMVLFHEYNAFHQISYTTTNETLLEAFAGKSRLHIVDVGIIKGLQWPILIDSLVNRPGGPPVDLRITTIRHQNKEACQSNQNNKVDAASADFMSRLVNFAKVLGLHLELNMYVGPLESITKEDLKLRDGEVLGVCCQYRLHMLSNVISEITACDSPTPQLSPRDAFLEFLSTLKPDVFVVSENDVDHCSEHFTTRFKEVVRFWWTFFDSTHVAFKGRDPDAQQIVEYEASMIMLNKIACEGAARIERNETMESWIKRIRRAGFVPKEMCDETKKAVQVVLQSTESEHWSVSYKDTNIVNLAWKNQSVNFTSLWKAPSCQKTLCKCNMLHN